jgi:hypothetical protein
MVLEKQMIQICSLLIRWTKPETKVDGGAYCTSYDWYHLGFGSGDLSCNLTFGYRN